RFYTGYNNYRVEIVGVVKDFNIASLHSAIKPLMMSPFPEYETEAGIKLKPGDDLPAALASVQTAWEKIFPDRIYESRFLERTIEHYYESESRLYGLFKIFAGLAILISCLGLWGLATFAAVQRTKEVGIRKVFGASTGGLVALLSKDFLILVAIALLVAAPIAWYGMHEWLQNFSYRIDIHWSIFAIAALSVLAIAFLTVSFQSVRSALANPIKSLRNE
nr:ABC transporter permease [Flavilitoribacter sp.]